LELHPRRSRGVLGQAAHSRGRPGRTGRVDSPCGDPGIDKGEPAIPPGVSTKRAVAFAHRARDDLSSQLRLRERRRLRRRRPPLAPAPVWLPKEIHVKHRLS
jgi:hypothetical protein